MKEENHTVARTGLFRPTWLFVFIAALQPPRNEAQTQQSQFDATSSFYDEEQLVVVFISIHIINKLFKPDRSKDHYKQSYRTGDGK